MIEQSHFYLCQEAQIWYQTTGAFNLALQNLLATTEIALGESDSGLHVFDESPIGRCPGLCN